MTDLADTDPRVIIKKQPSIVFLGLAERAACLSDSPLNVPKWNILGLTSFAFANFFPWGFDGCSLGFAIQVEAITPSLTFRFIAESGVEIGRVSMQFTLQLQDRPQSIEPTEVVLRHPTHGWMIIFAPIRGSSIMFQERGRYLIEHVTEAGNDLVGEFQVIQADVPPFSPEQVAAIRADPTASKAARAHIECKLCKDGINIYTALERVAKLGPVYKVAVRRHLRIAAI